MKFIEWTINKLIKNVDLRPRSLTTGHNTVHTDVIEEKTPDAGVTIDGALIKNGAGPPQATEKTIVQSFARIILPDVIKVTNDATALDGLKVEAFPGNIIQDLGCMTIIGGSSTAAGHSWMYWDLANAVRRVFVRAKMSNYDKSLTVIDLCSGSGATLKNPPNKYQILLKYETANKDVSIWKNVNGVGSECAYESIDISQGQFYNMEVLFEGDGAGSNRIRVCRDEYLSMDFSETETGIPNILSIRFRVYDYSTLAAIKGEFARPFIITTET